MNHHKHDMHYELIQRRYIKSAGDYGDLFQALLSVAAETGMDRALQYLETAIIEKRTRWLRENLDSLERTGNPVRDGFTIFYGCYLKASVPGQGEIIEETATRILSRWWNPCPTLEICRKLDLDTREICRKAFHRPVQAFLSAIDRGLRFHRNYECLRPYTPYCEEIIELS